MILFEVDQIQLHHRRRLNRDEEKFAKTKRQHYVRLEEFKTRDEAIYKELRINYVLLLL